MLQEGWRFERLEAKIEKKEEINEGMLEGENVNGKEEEKEEEGIRKQLEYIGLPLRRFFPGHGLSDGIIVGYLPASRNEGMELWRMEHQVNICMLGLYICMYIFICIGICVYNI